MKITDGLFHRVFDEIAQTYPHRKNEHLFLDHEIAKLATNPEYFDVIVAPNLPVDIVSDVAAEVADQSAWSDRPILDITVPC